MIKGWVEDLSTLTAEDWARYSFNHDPLVGRLPPASQLEHRQKAAGGAAALALRLRGEYPGLPIPELAKQQGVRLVFKRLESGTGYTLFASYEEPATITIFLNNAEATDQLLEEEHLQEWVGNIKTADLLIAHELYHYYEHILPDLYTTQKHVLLWKLGPFENRSRILCLEEIGAMAFAKELVGLKCSPHVFDVLMLYPQNPQRAKNLYESFMSYKEPQ